MGVENPDPKKSSNDEIESDISKDLSQDDPHMSRNGAQVGGTDRETEEKGNTNEKESNNCQEISFEELNIMTSDTTESEAPLADSEFTDFSSESLPSLSENLSIIMSDSIMYSEKEEMTNNDMEWEAADKEYMDITSEEGGTENMNLMENHIDMEFIDTQVHSLGFDSKENVKFTNNLSKVKATGARAQEGLSEVNSLSFTGEVFQSVGEQKIQKQNRMRNMIRRRIRQERNTSDHLEDRESGIFEMGCSDELDHWEEEDGKQENTQMAETMGLHMDILSKAESEPNPTTNISEPQLELQFYSLLNKLINDLRPNSVVENGIPLLDDKTTQTTIDRRSQTKEEAKTSQEHNISYENIMLNANNQDNKFSTLDVCYSCDVCTQTEKIKKCQIM